MSRETNQQIAAGLLQGLQNFTQGYTQRKQMESQQAIVNNPKSSTIQKALALAAMGAPQLANEVYKTNAKNEALQRINQEFNGLLNQEIMPGSAQNVARNATQVGPTSQIPGIGINGANAGPGMEQQPMPKGNVPQGTTQVDSPESLLQQASLLRKRAQKYSNEGFIPQANVDLSAANALENRALADRKLQRQIFESEKTSNEKRSAEYEKYVSGIRRSLPKKQQALNLARQAIESGELGAFSANNLAAILGRPELQNLSGAQLEIAVKENLLSNLSRISAKAANKWLEQVAIGAFPRAGRNREANLSIQEAIETEASLDEAQVKIYDQLAKKDLEEKGYVGGDIEARVSEAMKPVEQEAADRLSYRTRVLYEEEKGEKQLEKEFSKKPPTGTPLTRKMFQVFLKKTGSPEKAIEAAKRVGYKIYPNSKVEEFIK